VAAFFLSYSLLSEYQIQLEITPNIFGLVGVEVVWNEASLLWIGTRYLLKFLESKKDAAYEEGGVRKIRNSLVCDET